MPGMCHEGMATRGTGDTAGYKYLNALWSTPGSRFAKPPTMGIRWVLVVCVLLAFPLEAAGKSSDALTRATTCLKQFDKETCQITNDTGWSAVFLTSNGRFAMVVSATPYDENYDLQAAVTLELVRVRDGHVARRDRVVIGTGRKIRARWVKRLRGAMEVTHRKGFSVTTTAQDKHYNGDPGVLLVQIGKQSFIEDGDIADDALGSTQGSTNDFAAWRIGDSTLLYKIYPGSADCDDEETPPPSFYVASYAR